MTYLHSKKDDPPESSFHANRAFNIFYCERVRLGLGPAEAAKAAGVSRSIWWKYENGFTWPRANVLRNLMAQGFDVASILNNLPAVPKKYAQSRQ